MDVDGGEGATIIGERVTGPVGTEALEGRLMAVVKPLRVTGTTAAGMMFSDSVGTW